MTNAELLALLREAQDYVGFLPTRPDAIEKALSIQRRIDAALAEHDAAPTSEEKAGRFFAERDAAFSRGVAAMREAAVKEIYDKAHYLSEDWADDIRALSDPEDTHNQQEKK